jgi:ribulose-bisphosphate carboxylase small chain
MFFRLNGWITSACARRCRFLSLSFIANSPSSFILVATRVQTKIKKKRKVMKKRQNCEEDFERTKQKKIYLPAISSLSSLLNTNRMFETFSFLPPLSDADLTKQVQYLLNNGWTPCLEFEDPAHAYTDGHGWSGLDSSVNANYYDNRYWVMWKLPMYGCNNADEVIQEVKACVKAFPNCYVRCAGFDNIKQVQCAGFLCYRPKLDPMQGGARAVADRQV